MLSCYPYPITMLLYVQAAFAGTTLDELEDPLMAVNVPQSARLSQLFSTLQASPLLLRLTPPPHLTHNTPTPTPNPNLQP